MSAHRRIFAALLAIWLAVISQIAIAMPYCGSAPTARDVVPAGVASSAPMHADGDCPQHQQQYDNRTKLPCDDCAFCHMGCQAMLAWTVPPIRDDAEPIYAAASSPSLVTHIPEPPQPVPLSILA